MEANNVEVLILSGGRGTRLASVVRDVPKPMAMVAGKPFLHWLIKKLKDSSFSNITLLTGYKSEVISNYFGDGSSYGINIRYSHESAPLGTGGAIKKAISSSYSTAFLILNGDTYLDIDYKEVVPSVTPHDSFYLCLAQVEDISRFGAVEFDKSLNIVKFSEKDNRAGRGYINAGVYFSDRSIEERIPDGFVSLEKDVLPVLCQERKLSGLLFDAPFIDIGVPLDLIRAQSLIPSLI